MTLAAATDDGSGIQPRAASSVTVPSAGLTYAHRPETIHYFSLKEQFPFRVMDGLPLTGHKPTLFLTLQAAAALRGFTVN